MARTINPQRHLARRLAIIDAALTCFARSGYDRATTSDICAEAGIGSGTFFHYFPTKLDVLLALLRLGTDEIPAWFEEQRHSTDPLGVIEAFVLHSAAEMDDPRAPGLVRAVGAMMSNPDVAAALDRETAVTRDGLRPWVEQAIVRGQIRSDLPAATIVAWIQAVLDGYLGVLVADDAIARTQRQETLVDVVRRVLATEPSD